jgi:hypothetical protein
MVGIAPGHLDWAQSDGGQGNGLPTGLNPTIGWATRSVPDIAGQLPLAAWLTVTAKFYPWIRS